MRKNSDIDDENLVQPDEPVDQAAPDEKPAPSDTEQARRAIRKFTDSDGEGERTNLSLRSILGGDILAGAWFRRQFPFIVMIVLFIIIYVSNRYASQQELLEIDALQKQRIDEQYRALTRSSELMELTRRSSVENYLRTTNDSTLQTATVPPYTLDVDEN